MIERAYTVKEIDDLREAVENKILWNNYFGRYIIGMWANNTIGKDLYIRIEEKVRTHMIAGHVAEDLKKAGLEEIKKQLDINPALAENLVDEVREKINENS